MKYFFPVLILCCVLHVQAQTDLLDSLMKSETPKKDYVAYTFKSTRVINGHSIETVKKHTLDFRVSHRFGDIGANKGEGIHTLFGFDQASDIAIVFEYGITDDLTVGTGRMKAAGPMTELWNANIKYRLIKQTRDFKTPVTVTLFANTAISSSLSGDSTAVAYFPKTYQGFANRFSYVVQALVATKATDWLSLQIDPTFIWRDRVPYNDKNGLFVLGLSARAKINKRTAVIFEYFLPVMRNSVAVASGRPYFPMVRGIKNAGYYPPIHIGMEWETGGHIFHVNFTNSAGILENDFLAYNPHNWIQGQVRLGFTISRSFSLEKKARGTKYWKKGSVEDAK
jgi:hypothetical protein